MRSCSAVAFVLFVLLQDIQAVPGCRSKRQIPGGPKQQDPNDPVYQNLAVESLNVYMDQNSLTQSREVISVTEATTKVVAGKLTTIEFDALLDNSDVITCHSEILEQPWLKVKNITVTCDYNQPEKTKRSAPGSPVEKDVNDPVYTQLAEESIAKYKEENGVDECHQILKISKASKQVVAGTLTKIDFTLQMLFTNDILDCHSEIWERVWLNFKDIDVKCVKQN